MTEKQPYPVQPAPIYTDPYYQSGMPPPSQPIIFQTGMPRLGSSPQHLSKIPLHLR